MPLESAIIWRAPAALVHALLRAAPEVARQRHTYFKYPHQLALELDPPADPEVPSANPIIISETPVLEYPFSTTFRHTKRVLQGTSRRGRSPLPARSAPRAL